MRRFTRWPFLLFAVVLIGIGAMALAYVHSPGYRAGRAYARIHKGMTRMEAYAIIVEHGGEWEPYNRTGKSFCDVEILFGERCWVGLNLGRGSDPDGVWQIKEKFLSTRTFTQWVFDLVDSLKRANDPNRPASTTVSRPLFGKLRERG